MGSAVDEEKKKWELNAVTFYEWSTLLNSNGSISTYHDLYSPESGS